MKKAKVKSVRKRSTRAQVLETRKQIAIMVGTGIRTGAIAKLMDMSSANVSAHISKMKASGMILSNRKQTVESTPAPAVSAIAEAAAAQKGWTLQTPFGSVSLADGATIKIVGRTAEITW